jgi:hypothetical protein
MSTSGVVMIAMGGGIDGIGIGIVSVVLMIDGID